MSQTNYEIMLHNTPHVVPTHDEHPVMTKEVIEAYEKVLSYSRLKLGQQIAHRNVRIHENDFIHQIYTKSRSALPHFVFLHGYGGTSMTAIKLFQHLYPYFQVHALDTFGIGFSSRGKFSEEFTAEQARDYYIDSLEEWRKATKIDKMHLVGHSFGGYLAACYACKYPQNVAHLYLISPAGTNSRVVEANNQNQTLLAKLWKCLGEKVFGWKIRPSKAMSNYFIGNKIIKSVLTNRLKISEHEQQDWINYFNHVNSQQQSSQLGFYQLFGWPLNPKKTIEDMIRENKFPFQVDFYFGDSDWMTRDGAKRLVNQHFEGVQLTIIPNAGHQVVFDNAPYLCDKILDRLQQLQ